MSAATKAGLSDIYRNYIACLNKQDWPKLGSSFMPARKLRGDQPAHQTNIDIELIFMHHSFVT